MDVFKTPGAVSWTELTTPDPAAAAAFYSRLFGWDLQDMGDTMGGYRVIKIGEDAIGGIMNNPPGAPPMAPHWASYVTVADLDATLAKCTALGGKTLVPGMAIPTVGRMAVIQDPQGAVINVIQYAAM